MPKSKIKFVEVRHKPAKTKRTILSVLMYASGAATSYLAALAEVSPHQLTSVATGNGNASEETLERIAQVLDLQHVPASRLLDEVSSHNLTQTMRAYLGCD